MHIILKNFLDQSPELIQQKLEKNIALKKKVVLDFTGANKVSESFLEKALLPIMIKHSFEKIQNKIIFTAINEDIKIMLKNIINKSKNTK